VDRNITVETLLSKLKVASRAEAWIETLSRSSRGIG